MANPGLALLQFLGMGNFTGHGNMQSPMGYGGGYREDTYAQTIQPSKDGKTAQVIFNTMDPSPMGALMRENFRRLGIDSPLAGRKQIGLTARMDGNNLVFDIGGKERSITQEALQNARGLELQRLLGVQSYMDLAATKNNAANNAAYSKAGLQQPQVQATQNAKGGRNATVGAGPAGPDTGTQAGPASGRAANMPVDTTTQQQLMPIPTMQQQPFAMQQPAINPYAMMPLIPGYGIGGNAGPGANAPGMRFGNPGFPGTQFGYYGFADGSEITPPTNSGFTY